VKKSTVVHASSRRVDLFTFGEARRAQRVRAAERSAVEAPGVEPRRVRILELQEAALSIQSTRNPRADDF